MNALEPQLTEDLPATVRAPADWIWQAQPEYRPVRCVTVRGAIELLAMAIGAGLLAWVI